mgnify:FL=1
MPNDVTLYISLISLMFFTLSSLQDPHPCYYFCSLFCFKIFPYVLGFHLNNKLSSIFPESCLLIILGIVVGVIVYITLYFNDNEEINGGVAAEASQYTLHATTFFQVSLFCEMESG